MGTAALIPTFVYEVVLLGTPFHLTSNLMSDQFRRNGFRSNEAPASAEFGRPPSPRHDMIAVPRHVHGRAVITAVIGKLGQSHLNLNYNVQVRTSVA